MTKVKKQTDRQTDGRTWRLLDQLGPEGRVGENEGFWIFPTKKKLQV